VSAREAAPVDGSATYRRLVAIKRRLPEWLRYRIDPYNTVADRFVADEAEALPCGLRVLDAGAGECRHKPLFAHTHYFGTDNGMGDEEDWDYTQLSFKSNLLALPVGDGSMDVVVSVNVLEHVSEPIGMLSECRRVLREGGRLLLVAPQSWRLHQTPQDFFRFTQHGLDHALTRAGFEDLEIEAVGGAFWNLGSRSLYLLTHFKGVWFPVAILLSPLLGFLIPLLCFYLDRLDPEREDTLGYLVRARAPARGSQAAARSIPRQSRRMSSPDLTAGPGGRLRGEA
jgi:SAM-dependent methyltransferase